MASVPPEEPNRIEPAAPPEQVPPEPDPAPSNPPETEPIPPDFDEPDRCPEELPGERF